MKNFLKISKTLFMRFFDERLTYKASALAFTTLLALVPLLSVTVSALAILPYFEKFTSLAQNYVLTNFIPTSGAVIQHYFENFISQATKLPTMGIIFLLVTTLMLLITIEHAINEIWQVKNRRRRFSSFILYVLILIAAPIFIGLSVLISTFIFSLHWIHGATTELGIESGLLSCLPLLINALILSMLYIIVPNCRVNWKYGAIGGFIAAALFEVAKKGFAFYLLKFPSYEFIYGALATVPIFLVWIYISWLVVLFGAMVGHTLQVANMAMHKK